MRVLLWKRDLFTQVKTVCSMLVRTLSVLPSKVLVTLNSVCPSLSAKVFGKGPRPLCLPLMYGCKYLNFSRSDSEQELLARCIMNKS